jgi:glutathione S-transferase
MYILYNLPGSCSLATQVVLNELDQAVTIIDKNKVDDFSSINPVGSVPVLIADGKTLREGAAIILYLLNKHDNTMLPSTGVAREQGIQDIMFANSTMHPAYGRMYFIAHNISNEAVKQSTYEAAAEAITSLWQVIELQLAEKAFLGGAQPSAADILLAVYSRWGSHHPVDITMGTNTKKMLEAVQSMPSFKNAVAAEERQSVA